MWKVIHGQKMIRLKAVKYTKKNFFLSFDLGTRRKWEIMTKTK